MGWLGTLAELTNIDLQRRSWLDTEGQNPHWSFCEFMNCYFGCFGIEGTYHRFIQDGVVSTAEYEIVKDWHQALSSYKAPKDDDYNHQAILNDPAWLALVAEGEAARRRLEELLTNDELETINSSMKYPGPEKWP
ncbi:MAG TPA: hypothetical protein PLL57_15850 [Flavobacteriales bacterium]|nr:hypothetical protein [Flavobacteriales bacterium]